MISPPDTVILIVYPTIFGAAFCSAARNLPRRDGQGWGGNATKALKFLRKNAIPIAFPAEFTREIKNAGERVRAVETLDSSHENKELRQ